MENELTVLELSNHFGFQIVYGDIAALSRKITIARVDRPGLQLLGLFKFHEKERIMLIGNKEMAVINDNDPEFIYKNCLTFFSQDSPCVIITQGNSCPDCILRACKEKNVPLFLSNSDTSLLSSAIYIYLSEVLAPKGALHACLLEIYSVGVALMGESGIGKSEVSLELIKRGHSLVADDRVDITDVRGTIIGKCPENIKGMMEVRGIGIIDVSKMFGINALCNKTQIKLIIKLVQFDPKKKIERIGMKTEHYDVLNESIPLIELPVTAARSLADIIETAVTNFKLKEEGYDTGYEFTKRLQQIQDQKIEEINRMKSSQIVSGISFENNVAEMENNQVAISNNQDESKIGMIKIKNDLGSNKKPRTKKEVK